MNRAEFVSAAISKARCVDSNAACGGWAGWGREGRRGKRVGNEVAESEKGRVIARDGSLGLEVVIRGLATSTLACTHSHRHESCDDMRESREDD